MKYFITPLFVYFYCSQSVFAAHLYFDAPPAASSNRAPIAVTLFLDGGDESISGLSGDFSFPSELFTLESISTQNGIIPFWVVTPHISLEKTLDGRIHIPFEGIIPGGFSGVHSPYVEGKFPGILYTVILIPKASGSGFLSISGTEVHAFNDRATLLTSTGSTKSIIVPTLSGKENNSTSDQRYVLPQDARINIATSEYVQSGSPYVYVYDENPSHTIDHIEIAETDEYSPSHVASYMWHTAQNPYVLSYSSRTKYVHAKIVYTNNSYTFVTVPPVENSHSFLKDSRILIYILVAISLLYHYGKNFLHLLPKNRRKNL